MKCDEVLQFIDQYWDMADDDSTRIEIEAHLFDCKHCVALFDKNMFSFDQFTEIKDIDSFNEITAVSMNETVMNRIYQEEAWNMPISRKTYSFSKSFKRNIAILIASCLAIFSFFFFTIIFQDQFDKSGTSKVVASGVLDITVASSSGSTTSDLFSDYVPVASLSDPIVMRAAPTFSEYYIALSLFGIIMTLLLLNWFTRTKQ